MSDLPALEALVMVAAATVVRFFVWGWLRDLMRRRR